MPTFRYDPFDPAVVENPYPFYEVLRREHPVYRIESVGVLAVSRYEDVLEILKSPERFSSAPYGELIDAAVSLGDGPALEGESLLGTDPPVHTRLRKIVNRGFTRSRMLSMESAIRRITRRLARSLEHGGGCDLVTDYAMPIPVQVIAEILGIDPDRRADFKRWSDDLLMAVTGDMSSPERRQSLQRSLAELHEYVGGVVATRHARPCDDLISALIRAEGDEAVMSTGEVTNFINLLLVAGNEATTNLIANMMLVLLERPRLARALRRGRISTRAFAEETMRYDSPVQLTLRRATRDIELHRTTVERGQDIAVLIGAANRDERAFAAAQRFDPHRRDPAHLTFGLGAHFCIGAQLARMEAAIALETLVARFDNFRRTDAAPIERPVSWLVRGPKRLEISMDPVDAPVAVRVD